jgi:hypothetical protein
LFKNPSSFCLKLKRNVFLASSKLLDKELSILGIELFISKEVALELDIDPCFISFSFKEISKKI